MYKALLLGLFAAVPSSTNFALPAYDFGTGSGAPSSTSYQLQASTGSPAGTLGSSTYGLPAGVRASTSVATPLAPSLTNPENEYNRLRVILDVTGLPTDAKYLIAISDDNFTTMSYIQTDQTVGPSAGVSSYQTYAAWGGASGFWVLGLDYSTTYKVKVAALQDGGTGSGFGPMASAATVAPSVTFAVSTSLTSTPPFNLAFMSLPAGAVTSANATISADVTTNAQHGGAVLVRSQNAGLTSALGAFTLPSATADLSSTSSGYGAQVTATAQLTAVSPFNGAGHNVGGLTTAWQSLASFGAPVTSGSLTAALKAKTTTTTPAATDYTDALTLAVSLLF